MTQEICNFRFSEPIGRLLDWHSVTIDTEGEKASGENIVGRETRPWLVRCPIHDSEPNCMAKTIQFLKSAGRFFQKLVSLVA
jgi:hypothetical protein